MRRWAKQRLAMSFEKSPRVNQIGLGRKVDRRAAPALASANGNDNSCTTIAGERQAHTRTLRFTEFHGDIFSTFPSTVSFKLRESCSSSAPPESLSSQSADFRCESLAGPATETWRVSRDVDMRIY